MRLECRREQLSKEHLANTTMFELKDLPTYDILVQLGEKHNNPDVDGLQSWLIWASATSEMLLAFDANAVLCVDLVET